MSTTPPDYARRDLVSGSLARNLIRVSWPLAAGAILAALYNLVDAFWLGRLSREALGAPGVTMPFLFIVMSLGMGFGTAGTALVAQYVGAGRHREADHVAGQNLLLLTLMGTVLCIPSSAFASSILTAFRVPEDMRPQAIAYFQIVMAGLPFAALTMAYGAILRAVGDTMTVLIIGLLSNVLNAVLDPFMIFGWWVFPRMGTAGAAWATVISQVLAAVVCVVLLRTQRAGLQITLADIKPDWQVLRRTVSVGTPAALGNASNSIGFSVFQILINSLGTTVVGAFTIGFRIIHFFNVPAQSLAMAASPIIGQALGAGKPRLARKAVRLSMLLCTITMLPAVAALMWQGHSVARLFTPDADVVAEAGKFFLIVPFSSYLFGVIMVLSAAFTGSGHTKPAMLLAIVRLWLFRLPVGYILGFVFDWGSAGVYWGMVVGNIFGALITLWVVRRGTWQKAIIPVAAADSASGATAPPTPMPADAAE